MRKSILMILLAATSSVSIRAQSIGPATVNATGGSAVIGTNEFEWSVGEMTLITTLATSDIVITQGVLQPRDIPTKLVSATVINNLKVFPNPATSVVNVQYTSAGPGTLTYRLTDMLGQVIKSTSVDIMQGTTSEQINIAALACATYMLDVSIQSGNNSSEETTYKIDKLK